MRISSNKKETLFYVWEKQLDGKEKIVFTSMWRNACEVYVDSSGKRKQ